MAFRNLALLRGTHPEGSVLRVSVRRRIVAFSPARQHMERLGWKNRDRIVALVDDETGLCRLFRHESGWALRNAGGNAASGNQSVHVPKRIGDDVFFVGVPETLPPTPIRDVRMVSDPEFGDGLEFALP